MIFQLPLKIIQPFFLLAALLICRQALAQPNPVTSNIEYQSVMSLPVDIGAGREVFFNCTKCHGTEGWGSYGGEYPQLAGQHNSVIIKQLIDIRQGNRNNPLMLPVVAEMNDQDIVNVAGYIAVLKMNPDPGVGEAEDEVLIAIEKTYLQQCSSCHGKTGAGDADKFYPLLQGQNYEYLLRQLKLIQAGKRKNSNPDMQTAISKMSKETLALLADYISRLEPVEQKMAPFGWENTDFQ